MTDVVVIDASALVEFLRATSTGDRVAEWISQDDLDLHTPHTCPLEVASALRGLVLGAKASTAGAERALQDLPRLDVTRHPVEPHLPRIWALRENLTVYDAAYVALAEALDATLVTSDRKLATPFVRRLIHVEVIR